MSKHTSGNWEAVIISDYKPNTITETYIKKIAIVGPVKENGGQSHIAEISLQFGEDQSTANAQVIAKAPKMLDQLRRAERLLCARPLPSDPGLVQSLRELRQVIAEAEGNKS